MQQEKHSNRRRMVQMEWKGIAGKLKLHFQALQALDQWIKRKREGTMGKDSNACVFVTGAHRAQRVCQPACARVCPRAEC